MSQGIPRKLRLPKEKIEGMRQTLDAYPDNYKRRVDEDGYGYMEFACYSNADCGCCVVGNGTLQLPFTVKFCKAHQAGVNTELLEAVKGLLETSCSNSFWVRKVRAVIAKAEEQS